MRLDEWQKYIDSQFLDEEATPAAAPPVTTHPHADVKRAALAPTGIDSAALSGQERDPFPTEDGVPTPTDAPLISPQLDTHQAVTASLSIDAPLPLQQSSSSEQKWTTVEPPVASAPTVTLSEADNDSMSSTMLVSNVTEVPETTPNSIQNIVTLVVAPSIPPKTSSSTSKPPRIELLTPLPPQTDDSEITPEVNNRTRRRSQSAPLLSETASPAANAPGNSQAAFSTPPDVIATGLFHPVGSLDTEIPAFERYLPSSHAASAGFSVEKDTKGDAKHPDTPREDQRNSALDLSSEISGGNETPDGKATQAAVLLPPEEDGEPFIAPGEDADNLPDAGHSRRAPKSRARHARNVRPANVLSGLSATELWATVPRHVQTLLSLERLEEEKEVAQFSYKRPFQEKRHELIERLLDPILSLEDTARLLNVCPTTVRRYTNKGILTHYRKEPERSVKSVEAITGSEKETRQRRFRLSDILTFLETQQAAIAADRQVERRAETLTIDITADAGEDV